PAKPGSGASPVPVSAALTGLTENTTYHFRLVAENTNAKDETLEPTSKTGTPPPLPTDETKAANPVGTTTATLNGSVNPNGVDVTKCEFESGTTPFPDPTLFRSPAKPGSGASPVPVSAALTGLTENTTYHFRLVAENT